MWRGARPGEPDLQRAIAPADDHVVLGEPAHAQDDVVALQWRGGERGGEADGGSLRGGERVRDGHLTGGSDNGAIGELDRAVGRLELQAAAGGIGGVDESGPGRAAVDQRDG